MEVAPSIMQHPFCLNHQLSLQHRPPAPSSAPDHAADERLALAHTKISTLRSQASELRAESDRLTAGSEAPAPGSAAAAIACRAARLELQAYLLHQRYFFVADTATDPHTHPDQTARAAPA